MMLTILILLPLVGALVTAFVPGGLARTVGLGFSGATLVAGGPGKPEGLDKGYYVKPNVFANVTNDMTIAREEIFGPVLIVIPFDGDADGQGDQRDHDRQLLGQGRAGRPGDEGDQRRADERHGPQEGEPGEVVHARFTARRARTTSSAPPSRDRA